MRSYKTDPDPGIVLEGVKYLIVFIWLWGFPSLKRLKITKSVPFNFALIPVLPSHTCQVSRF